MPLARSTLINLAGAVAPTLISLVFVPLFLHLIGDVRYGILALSGLFLNYFRLFDLGIGKATANQMARLRHASASERESVFWMGLLTNGVFGAFGGLLLFVSGHFVVNGYFADTLSIGMRNEIYLALPWLAAAVPLALVSAVNVAALEAQERFFILNLLQVFGTILLQLLPLATAYWRGPALDGLIAASVAARVAAWVPLFLACRRYVPLRGRPHLRSDLMGPLIRYGSWVTVSSVIGPILSSLDQILIGSRIGPRAVAHYTVPFNLVGKFQVLPASLTRALFPRFSLLQSGSMPVAERAVSSLAAVTLPMVLVATVLVKPFLSAWLGSEFARFSAPVGQILLIGMWVNSLAFIPFTLLQGQGRPDIVAKLHALELIPYVVVLWIAIKLAGLQGAACAWVARMTIDGILLFYLAGLRTRIVSVVGSGLAIIIAMQLVIELVAHIPVVHAGAMIAFAIAGLVYFYRVAPPEMWASLARIVPLDTARLALGKSRGRI
jgi:O-antigen/teichoic acid export membrane protein